jgi:hypothetical protein
MRNIRKFYNKLKVMILVMRREINTFKDLIINNLRMIKLIRTQEMILQ